MKIRKVLLKNINQKILQEIKLNHCIISIILRRRSNNHSHVGFTDFWAAKGANQKDKRSLHFQEREAPQQYYVCVYLS